MRKLATLTATLLSLLALPYQATAATRHRQGRPRHHRSSHAIKHHPRARHAEAEEDSRPLRVEPDGTEVMEEHTTTPQDEREAAETPELTGPEAEELIAQAQEEGVS